MGALDLALLVPSALALVVLSLYRLATWRRRHPRRASLPPERDVWANYQREIVRQRSERRAS